MVRRVLQCVFSPLIVLVTVIGCSSGSDSVPSSSGEGNEPLIGQANGGAIQEEAPFASVIFGSGVLVDTGYFHRIALNVKNDVHVEGSVQQLAIDLQGAAYFVEKQQPDNCIEVTENNSTEDDLAVSLVCDLSTMFVDAINDQSVELSLPVYVSPHQAHDFTVSATLINDDSPSVDKSLHTSISYSPDGNTELSMDSDVINELKRVLQIGKGDIVRSVHEGFRSLDGCPDGGQIERVSGFDYFFGTRVSRYVNCMNGGVVFDGETSSGLGRSSASRGFHDATMTISEPEFIDFSGTAEFSIIQGSDPDKSTLKGQIEKIDSKGEITRFNSYDTYCKDGYPRQPHQVFSGLIERDPLVTLQADFETDDKFQQGSRINVSIEAKWKNLGTVSIQSDSGSQMNIVMAGGPFSTVFIDLSGENSNENWIVPWTEELSFECILW